MTDYQYLPVSDGTGDAALMHIMSNRSIGSTTIAVDSVSRVPAFFLATAGTLLASGFIDPTTKTDFKGHVSGGNLIIDAFEPGSTDTGNTSGQVVVIKPNTGWANRVSAFINASQRGPFVEASDASPTPNVDLYNVFIITAQAVNSTFGVPTGTPADGQSLLVRIKDNGTSRTLAFNAIYRFSTDLPAPTATVTGKVLYMGFVYNSADNKWDNISQLTNF